MSVTAMEMAREWLSSITTSETEIKDLARVMDDYAATRVAEALEHARLEILSACMNAWGDVPGSTAFNAGVAASCRAVNSLKVTK